MDKKDVKDDFFDLFDEDTELFTILLFLILFNPFSNSNAYQITDIDKRLSKLEGKIEMLENFII